MPRIGAEPSDVPALIKPRPSATEFVEPILLERGGEARLAAVDDIEPLDGPVPPPGRISPAGVMRPLSADRSPARTIA